MDYNYLSHGLKTHTNCCFNYALTIQLRDLSETTKYLNDYTSKQLQINKTSASFIFIHSHYISQHYHLSATYITKKYIYISDIFFYDNFYIVQHFQNNFSAFWVCIQQKNVQTIRQLARIKTSVNK